MIQDKTRHFFSNLGKMFTLKERGVVNAREAYMTSKYGAPINEEVIYNETIKTINFLIKEKIHNTMDCALVKNLRHEMQPYYEDLVKYYEDRGYTTYLIDNNSTINGKKIIGMPSAMIIITWGNFIPQRINKVDDNITDPDYYESDYNEYMGNNMENK